MKQFIAKFESQMQGTLSGLDRVVFRGSLRRLTHPQGMKMYLIRNGLLCKEYFDHVKKVSQDLKEASLEAFHQLHLPTQFINNPKADKDEIARAHAAKLGIREGNVCALTAMELTPTFQHEKTSMAVRYRPTLVIYHYQIDPDMGWMHARIQTWFPFYVHLCINGREWLARSMDRQGLHYFRQDNCFPWIQDISRAQQLMDQQLESNWTERLQPFAQRLNPLHEQIFQKFDAEYYWSAFQCEWASDILFKPGTLAHCAKRMQPTFQSAHIGNAQRPQIKSGASAFGDHIGARASFDDAGVDGYAAAQVVPFFNARELPRKFVDGVDTFLRSKTGMRGAAMHDQFCFADSLAGRLQEPARAKGRLQDKNSVAAARFRFKILARRLTADLLIGSPKEDQAFVKLHSQVLKGLQREEGLHNSGFHVEGSRAVSFTASHAKRHFGECSGRVDRVVVAQDQELARRTRLAGPMSDA